MTRLADKTRDKLKAAEYELHEITSCLQVYRVLPGYGNLAEVWELEKKRRKISRIVLGLQNGGSHICPYCGGYKTTTAVACKGCRYVNIDIKTDALAEIAHNSAEAQAFLSEPVQPKRLDRVVRAFRRWFEWRQRHMTRIGSLKNTAHLNKCECGAYKLMSANTCDECREAKKVLRRRIHQAGRDLHDEPPIAQERVPRVIRLLSPSMWETDTNNGWDDIIRVIENG
jgi:hypothetical protein